MSRLVGGIRTEYSEKFANSPLQMVSLLFFAALEHCQDLILEPDTDLTDITLKLQNLGFSPKFQQLILQNLLHSYFGFQTQMLVNIGKRIRNSDSGELNERIYISTLLKGSVFSHANTRYKWMHRIISATNSNPPVPEDFLCDFSAGFFDPKDFELHFPELYEFMIPFIPEAMNKLMDIKIFNSEQQKLDFIILIKRLTNQPTLPDEAQRLKERMLNAQFFMSQFLLAPRAELSKMLSSQFLHRFGSCLTETLVKSTIRWKYAFLWQDLPISDEELACLINLVKFSSPDAHSLPSIIVQAQSPTTSTKQQLTDTDSFFCRMVPRTLLLFTGGNKVLKGSSHQGQPYIFGFPKDFDSYDQVPDNAVVKFHVRHNRYYAPLTRFSSDIQKVYDLIHLPHIFDYCKAVPDMSAVFEFLRTNPLLPFLIDLEQIKVQDPVTSVLFQNTQAIIDSQLHQLRTKQLFDGLKDTTFPYFKFAFESPHGAILTLKTGKYDTPTVVEAFFAHFHPTKSATPKKFFFRHFLEKISSNSGIAFNTCDWTDPYSFLTYPGWDDPDSKLHKLTISQMSDLRNLVKKLEVTTIKQQREINNLSAQVSAINTAHTTLKAQFQSLSVLSKQAKEAKEAKERVQREETENNEGTSVSNFFALFT